MSGTVGATLDRGAPTAAEADRAARNAALTLAAGLPGDTLLYLLLPLYAAEFGVSLPEAGLLLAANRLVRIAGYGWVGRFYADGGPRRACLVASIGSIAAALGYATLSGVWPLLVARLIWGLSFAAMNIANQALSTVVPEGAVRRSARVRTIVAASPMTALIVGALIAQAYGPRAVFWALTATALAGPLAALRLPALREPTRRQGPRFSRPEALSLWSFSMGFTMDGLFIFGLGLIAAARYPGQAVLAAGVGMALRYATEVVFSPLGGVLGERFGARWLLLLLSFGSALSLALLAVPGHLFWTGMLGTIVLRALTQTLTAPVVAEITPGAERVAALARQATWRDIGAGAGPLAAGVLFGMTSPAVIYGAAAVLVAASSLLLLKAWQTTRASATG